MNSNSSNVLSFKRECFARIDTLELRLKAMQKQSQSKKRFKHLAAARKKLAAIRNKF